MYENIQRDEEKKKFIHVKHVKEHSSSNSSTSRQTKKLLFVTDVLKIEIEKKDTSKIHVG